jgi:hypothetical protein
MSQLPTSSNPKGSFGLQIDTRSMWRAPLVMTFLQPESWYRPQRRKPHAGGNAKQPKAQFPGEAPLECRRVIATGQRRLSDEKRVLCVVAAHTAPK